jgi:PST family polysaccharide transporter
LGVTVVGYYTVAQRLLAILNDLIGGSTQSAVLPLFARIKDDAARVSRGLQTAQDMLSMAVIPAAVGLTVIAPVLVPLALGPGWTTSILPAQILFSAGLVYRLSSFFGPVMTALGYPEMRLRVAFFRGLTQVALIGLGLRHGIVGVACAMAATQVLFYGIELAVLRHLVEFDVVAYVSALAKPCLAAAAMALPLVRLGRLLGTRPLLVVSAEVALGVAIYASVMLVLARPRVGQLVSLVCQLRDS